MSKVSFTIIWINLQSDVSIRLDAGVATSRRLFLSIGTIPPWSLHQIVCAQTTNVATCPRSSTLAHNGWRNNSSPRNLQLTVHLKRNTLERSNAWTRYSRGNSRKNGPPMNTWLTMIKTAYATLHATPRRRHRSIAIPGAYSSADIFTDNARLTLSVSS